MDSQKLVLESIRKIQESRKETYELIKDVNEEDFTFKEEDEKWCLAEIIHHLTLIEEYTFAYIIHFKNKIPKSRLKAITGKTRTKFKVPLEKFPKVEVPIKEIVPGRFMTKDLVLELMPSARKRLESHLLGFEDVLANAFQFSHPLLGKMNLFEWCDFLAIHEKHHQKQIREILNSL